MLVYQVVVDVSYPNTYPIRPSIGTRGRLSLKLGLCDTSRVVGCVPSLPEGRCCMGVKPDVRRPAIGRTVQRPQTTRRTVCFLVLDSTGRRTQVPGRPPVQKVGNALWPTAPHRGKGTRSVPATPWASDAAISAAWPVHWGGTRTARPSCRGRARSSILPLLCPTRVSLSTEKQGRRCVSQVFLLGSSPSTTGNREFPPLPQEP